MTRKIISVTSSQPVSILSDQPVTITVEGDTVTVAIDDLLPRQGDGLATPKPRKPRKPAEDLGPRCGVEMPRAKVPCGRVRGHNGPHMTAKQVQRKQDYNKDRARERYQTDPEYAEKVKAAVRDSQAKQKKAEEAPAS